MTKIYLDTANLAEIEEIKEWGIISGVTTNQAIFLKEKGCVFEDQANRIVNLVYPFPVSLEGPNDLPGILEKSKIYHNLGKRGLGSSTVVIKVPMTKNGDGLRAVNVLSKHGIKTNVTACMTVNQVFLAACAGATYVSLFFNRMKDMEDEEYALRTIKESSELLKNFHTELIIGSIRSADDIPVILRGKPDIITIPYKILKHMPFNTMTEKTLKEFEKAWEEFCEGSL